MRSRKKYRSVITKRIVGSIRKILMILSCLVFILTYGSIQDTNSFYVDNAISSSNSFSAGYWVSPAVEVTSPESGDVWQVGSTHNITWIATSSDPSKTASMDVDINYRCDGGSWNNIVNGTANDGTYSWTVPEDISDDCQIRIFATDDYSLTGMDDSDEFEISWMVVLNEFVPNPASENLEFVEIYNYGDESIDVDDWFITDNQGPALHRRIIDAIHTDTGSTIINPSSSRFLVIENYNSFYLNNTGNDEVRLYDDAGNLIDRHDFSDALQGKSYARMPDGVGNWVDPVPTPGKKNSASNNLEDMREYYKKACFEDEKPICKESFLKSLGLLEGDNVDDNKKEKKEEPKEKNFAEVSVEAPSLPAETKSDDSSGDDSQKDVGETKNGNPILQVDPQDEAGSCEKEENPTNFDENNNEDKNKEIENDDESMQGGDIKKDVVENKYKDDKDVNLEEKKDEEKKKEEPVQIEIKEGKKEEATKKDDNSNDEKAKKKEEVKKEDSVENDSIKKETASSEGKNEE